MKAYKCWVLKNVLRAGRRSLVPFQKKNKRYDFSVNLCHILVLCIAVLVLKWLATIFFGFFSLYLTKQIQADKSTHAECLNSSVRFVSGEECFSILTLPLNANDDGKKPLYCVLYKEQQKQIATLLCYQNGNNSLNKHFIVALICQNNFFVELVGGGEKKLPTMICNQRKHLKEKTR